MKFKMRTLSKEDNKMIFVQYSYISYMRISIKEL